MYVLETGSYLVKQRFRSAFGVPETCNARLNFSTGDFVKGVKRVGPLRLIEWDTMVVINRRVLLVLK